MPLLILQLDPPPVLDLALLDFFECLSQAMDGEIRVRTNFGRRVSIIEELQSLHKAIQRFL